jgi:BirA family transcriptional regulator, biotin operon repressor / biotin---[acetyl-CoA-carboxylase] ligase
MSLTHWYPTLPSTMIEAARLAAQGAPHGTIVAAEEQTEGQGSHGRSWLSHRGDGLYATFILRPSVQPADIPCITLCLGLAVVDALTALTSRAYDIRWPNDVLHNSQKVCGILARMEDKAVLAGIGINCNQLDFPPGLRTPATSLRLITGRQHVPAEVLEALAPAVQAQVDVFQFQGREAILRLFANASSYVADRRVTVDADGVIMEGTTAGLDPHGFLKLRKEDGTHVTISNGSVRPA